MVPKHITHNIHTENFNSIDVNDPLNYLYNAFNKPIPAINLKMITSKEIENVFKFLKPKGSHGYDEIPTKILKLSVLYHVISVSLSPRHGTSSGCRWRIAANKLNKQPRTADEGWSFSLGVGRGANNASP